ncbi:MULTISPECIES: DUF6124 family protein [Pseudomonas]|uniref:Uncharacterized protein n=1 Tax=Pseudomonas fluorescens TaxID=294 RepID=A0ACD4XRA7_PSEFL|nr:MULTISPECIES: hypothetical protein [Pseudomonas]MBZ6458331.1 hypothetical protein [Pseudomonas fluorescens group sp.]MBZ6461860.1 hypothetical protein [Pseudomonas fluorescens group sp.]MBZ6467574.1 hypothetical protein [Pseudomonas fluorescens group sp.]PLR64673.1 hypothetical protein QCBJ_04965 [Pseudomonas sp. QC2]WQD71719.1 hypothetical protein U0037_27365 [Pseudomonas marginalis]
MDKFFSDSPSSAATNPFTVNEELSFEDAWVRVAELLQCAVATSQVLGQPLAAPQRAVMHLVEMAKMVADRAVECMQPK